MKHDLTHMQNIYIVCGKMDMRKGIDGLAILFRTFLKWILLVTQYFYFQVQISVALSVYISTVMAFGSTSSFRTHSA